MLYTVGAATPGGYGKTPPARATATSTRILIHFDTGLLLSPRGSWKLAPFINITSHSQWEPPGEELASCGSQRVLGPIPTHTV
ncbi:hypothetical protein AAY473_004051 [Plecturocebus cupreus]